MLYVPIWFQVYYTHIQASLCINNNAIYPGAHLVSVIWQWGMQFAMSPGISCIFEVMTKIETVMTKIENTDKN